MSAQPRPPESELAKIVIAYLIDLKWDVYQEVQVYRGGPVADIIAVRGQVTMAVECKASANLTVIKQADYWCYRTSYSVIAAPVACQGIVDQFLRWRGIGYFRIQPQSFYGKITETLAPRLFRKSQSKEIIAKLQPEHKTYAIAGTNNGKHWSAYKQTCQRLERIVATTPGIELSAALKEIKHHYSSNSSARGSLAHWGLKGQIEGVRFQRDGKGIKLFPSSGGSG